MAPKESTLIDEPSGTSKYMSMYGKFSTDGCKFFENAKAYHVVLFFVLCGQILTLEI